MEISLRGKRFKFSRNSFKFQYPWPSPGRVEQHIENTISVAQGQHYECASTGEQCYCLKSKISEYMVLGPPVIFERTYRRNVIKC